VRTHARRAAGFTLLETLVGVAVTATLALVAAQSFKAYVGARGAVDSVRSLATVEEQIVTSMWRRISQAVKTGATCDDLSTLPAKVATGWRVGKYGGFATPASIAYAPTPGSLAAAAVGRCNSGSAGSFAGPDDVTRSYFCLQIKAIDTPPRDSFFANASGGDNRAFVEVSLGFRDVATDQPISCKTFKAGDPTYVGSLTASLYWSRRTVNGVAHKRRDITYFGPNE
jgi:type II secretory pathway pseudopilin PulG